jgi:hypothetical protein
LGVDVDVDNCGITSLNCEAAGDGVAAVVDPISTIRIDERVDAVVDAAVIPSDPSDL